MYFGVVWWNAMNIVYFRSARGAVDSINVPGMWEGKTGVAVRIDFEACCKELLNMCINQLVLKF